MPSFARSRSGLTLIEILISIAIIGIISAIVFIGFSNEQQRNAARRAAEQVQIDVQAMQNRAQSGLLLPDGTSAEGYGLLFIKNAITYDQFGDKTGSVKHQNDPPNDALLATRNLIGDVEIYRFETDPMLIGEPNSLHAVYDLPDGNLHLTGVLGATSEVYAVATVILRQIQANLCYSVTIRAASGTVSPRQNASC